MRSVLRVACKGIILLATCACKGTQSLQYGVVSEFRAQFVKTGLIEPQYSQFYGDAMDARQSSDYDSVIEPACEQAEAALDEAQRFVDRIERFLRESGYDSVAGMAVGFSEPRRLCHRAKCAERRHFPGCGLSHAARESGEYTAKVSGDINRPWSLLANFAGRCWAWAFPCCVCKSHRQFCVIPESGARFDRSSVRW